MNRKGFLEEEEEEEKGLVSNLCQMKNHSLVTRREPHNVLIKENNTTTRATTTIETTVTSNKVQVPKDIMVMILLFSDIRDVTKFRLVSKEMKDMVDNNHFLNLMAHLHLFVCYDLDPGWIQSSKMGCIMSMPHDEHFPEPFSRDIHIQGMKLSSTRAIILDQKTLGELLSHLNQKQLNIVLSILQEYVQVFQKEKPTLLKMMNLIMLVLLYGCNDVDKAYENMFIFLKKIMRLYDVSIYYMLAYLFQFGIIIVHSPPSYHPHMKNRVNISNKIGVRIILYLIHKFRDVCHYLCKRVDGVKLTQEQVKVLNFRVKGGDIVKITGFAGTGKTEVMRQYALRHSDQNILYISCNDASVERAITKFPSNVKCSTWKSLVCASFIPEEETCNSVSQVAPHLSSHERMVVVQTIESYTNSSDHSIYWKHIPIREENHSGYIKLAKDIFQKICAKCLPSYGICLKSFQLSNAVIGDYDVIMIDESQDIREVEIDILMNKRGKAGLMFAGDPHQSIHFSGDRLTNVKETMLFHLTRSFRFGFEAAYTFSSLLNKKGRQMDLVIGNDNARTMICHTIKDSPFDHTYIAMSTICLVEYAFAQVLKGNVYFEFCNKEEVFKCFDLISKAFLEYVKNPFQFYHYWMQNDRDYVEACKIVLRYGRDTLDILGMVKNTPGTSNAIKISLFTVKDVRGLEFDHVILSSEFNNSFQLYREIYKVEPSTTQDINLYYMAATRAKNLVTVEGKDMFPYFVYQTDRCTHSYDVHTSSQTEVTHYCPCSKQFKMKPLQCRIKNKRGDFICDECIESLKDIPLLDLYLFRELRALVNTEKLKRSIESILTQNPVDDNDQSLSTIHDNDQSLSTIHDFFRPAKKRRT